MPQRVIPIQPDTAGGAWANEESTAIANTLMATNTTIVTSLTNFIHRGADWVLTLGTETSAPSITFRVQGQNPVDSTFFSILASAAQTGTSTALFFSMYPGQAETANQHVDNSLPRNYRIMIDPGNDSTPTVSVGEIRLL